MWNELCNPLKQCEELVLALQQQQTRPASNSSRGFLVRVLLLFIN